MQVDKIRLAYKDGKSVHDIAWIFGCTRHRVRAAIALGPHDPADLVPTRPPLPERYRSQR